MRAFSLRYRGPVLGRKASCRGFTLFEIVMVVLLMGLVITFVAIALADARDTSIATTRSATATQLNRVAERILVKGDVAPLGADAEVVMTWYVDNGYIQRPVELEGITWAGGRWSAD